MNKAEIDKMLPKAYALLESEGIAHKNKNGDLEIVKTYRGQISSFGAAIVGGSLLSAIAFFSNKGGSDVDRPALMSCILDLVKSDGNKAKNLFEYAKSEIAAGRKEICTEDILNAALALKLAMNLYILG